MSGPASRPCGSRLAAVGPEPRRRRPGALLGVLLAALGCGDAGESTGSGGDPEPAAAESPDDLAPGDKPAPAPTEPARGGEPDLAAGARVVVAVRRLPATLDPCGDLDAWGQRVVDDLVFQGLTRRVASPVDGAWGVPDLADRCVPLADGKTVACRLRPEARFHDDQPVTVDDVVHSVNRWLGPRGAGLRQRYGLDELRTVEVGAPPGESGTWVRLGFGHRDPLVLERIAAIKIVPRRLHAGPRFAREPVGSGPLKLRERSEDRLIFAPTSGVGPELELRAIADGAAAITALRRGEIHVLAEVSPAHVPGELAKPGMATRFKGFLVSPAIYDLILYNLREGAQAGPRLRGALDQAVPRGELARSVYAEPGLATAAPVDLHAPQAIDLAAIADPVTAGLGAWEQPDPADDAAAIVAADRVLVELGWVLDRETRKRGTTNLRLPLSWDGSPGLASAAARAVRAGWKQLGISAPNVTAGWAYVLTLLRAGKFSVALARLAGGSDTDLAPWFHSRGAHNLTGVHDGELDAALDAYRLATDRAGRDAAKAAIAARLAALRPVTVLHAPLQVLLVARTVGGLEFMDDLPRLDRLSLTATP